MTRVINIHHKVSYDVYIGRPSKWSNPYSHMDNTTALYKVATRDEAVDRYKEYILGRPDLLVCLGELKGKVLGCYCEPKRCHGHILAELVDKVE